MPRSYFVPARQKAYFRLCVRKSRYNFRRFALWAKSIWPSLINFPVKRLGKFAPVLISTGGITFLSLFNNAVQAAGIINLKIAHLWMFLTWVISVCFIWVWQISNTGKPSKRFVLIVAILLAIFTFGADQMIVRLRADQDKEAKSAKTSAQQSILTEQDRKQIEELFRQTLKLKDNERTIYEKNSGFSLQSILRIYPLPESRKQYLFDYGKDGYCRWSIYLDEENIFTFSLTDKHGKPHTIRVPQIPFDEFIFLSCESALRDESASLRIKIDGKLVASQDWQAKIEMEPFNPDGGVIGADLQGKNGVRFDLVELLVYESTLTTNETEKIQQYFQERNINSFVRFNGHQWLRHNSNATK